MNNRSFDVKFKLLSRNYVIYFHCFDNERIKALSEHILDGIIIFYDLLCPH